MSAQQKQKKSGPVVHERVKKPKSASQLAKKAKNEADAAARLIVLKQEQAVFATLREEHGALSDEQCRALLAEQAARKALDVLLACDMPVGGETFSKRLMRFIGKERLKGIAAGNVAVREIIGACWTYASTQSEVIRPVDE